MMRFYFGFSFLVLNTSVSISGLLQWFDEFNQVKML